MHTIREYKTRAFVSFTLGVFLLAAGWELFAPQADWPELAFDGALLAWGIILLFFAAHNLYKASSANEDSETYDVTAKTASAAKSHFVSILPTESHDSFRPAEPSESFPRASEYFPLALEQRILVRREEDRYYRAQPYQMPPESFQDQEAQPQQPRPFAPRHQPPDPLWVRYKSSTNYPKSR